MSASRSGSPRSVRRPSSKKKKAAPPVAAARAPWIKQGIDYGPARAALGDLASWALDLAERSVEDWPAGRAHVRATRWFVDAQLTGKRLRNASTDDVMFTAQLLARIFDEDLGLGVSDALTILDTLNLPIDVLPFPYYTPSATHPLSNVVPLRTRTAAPHAPASRVIAPPLLQFCDECGYVHEPGDHVRHRNAA